MCEANGHSPPKSYNFHSLNHLIPVSKNSSLLVRMNNSAHSSKNSVHLSHFSPEQEPSAIGWAERMNFCGFWMGLTP